MNRERVKFITVLFAGRLGDDKYYDMDRAVVRALGVFEKEMANSI